MNFKNLVDIREDADITQGEMAQILKTTQSNYSRWENEKELMPLRKLNLLCNYFDVNMDYVVGLSKNNKGNGTHILKAETVGKNLKIFRKNNNLTQCDLAEFLKTSQSTISAYESGKTILLTSFALQICKKYKISLDWLCGRKTK